MLGPERTLSKGVYPSQAGGEGRRVVWHDLYCDGSCYCQLLAGDVLHLCTQITKSSRVGAIVNLCGCLSGLLISLLKKAFINGTDTKVFVSESAENQLSSVQDPEFCAAPYIGVFYCPITWQTGKHLLRPPPTLPSLLLFLIQYIGGWAILVRRLHPIYKDRSVRSYRYYLSLGEPIRVSKCFDVRVIIWSTFRMVRGYGYLKKIKPRLSQPISINIRNHNPILYPAYLDNHALALKSNTDNFLNSL